MTTLRNARSASNSPDRDSGLEYGGSWFTLCEHSKNVKYTQTELGGGKRYRPSPELLCTCRDNPEHAHEMGGK